MYEPAISQLEAFIEAPVGARVKIALPISYLSWVAAGFLWFVAAGVVFGFRSRCEFDRDRDDVSVEAPGCFRTRRTNYRLSEVERFAIRQKVIPTSEFDYEGDEKMHEGPLAPDSTRLVLAMRMKNGREITLAEPMFGSQRGLRFVRLLEEFRRAAATCHRTSDS